MEDGKFLESVGKRISRRGAEGSTGGTWEDELEGYYSAPPIGWVPTESGRTAAILSKRRKGAKLSRRIFSPEFESKRQGRYPRARTSLNTLIRRANTEPLPISTIAFVVYDWLVTLSREVDLFWAGNARPLSTMLYFANKYLNILLYVVTGVQMAPTSNKSCAKMAIVFRVLLCLSYIPPAVIQVVAPMVAFIVYPVLGISSSTWGCIGGTAVPLSSDPLGEISTVFITYRASIILADTMLVVITWKFLPASSITRHTLLRLIVMVGFPVEMEEVAIDVSYLTAPVSSVLVSHFLLDLQEAYQRTTTVVTDNPSDISLDTSGSMQFASALGSVAAISGLAADSYQVQEGEEEGEGARDGVGGDENLTAGEGVHPDEGEVDHESQSEDELAIMEVLRIEDEFAITEVPRVRAGEATVEPSEGLVGWNRCTPHNISPDVCVSSGSAHGSGTPYAAEEGDGGLFGVVADDVVSHRSTARIQLLDAQSPPRSGHPATPTRKPGEPASGIEIYHQWNRNRRRSAARSTEDLYPKLGNGTPPGRYPEALVVYDWIETLPREVNLFWIGKARPLPAILYFVNKYLNLLSCIVSGPSWSAYSYIYPSSHQRGSLIWLHVYGVPSAAWGCISGLLVLPSTPVGEMRHVVNRVTLILADTILIVVTLKFLPASVVMTYHALTKSWKLKGLAYVMLCNAQLVLTVGFSVVPDGLFFHIWFYTFPLSSVLVSHFLLDLQEEHQRTGSELATDGSSDSSQEIGSSLQFAGGLGSIGSVIGLAADHAQEGEGDDAIADDHSVAAEVNRPDEGEVNHEPQIEDELEIMEVLRVGEGEVIVGTI
ncbi:hypothetical protein V8D89_003781 [Ganoderma adspersum]